jgi:hypothetical protein
MLGAKGDFMNATLTLPIDVELQGLLAQKAAQGINVETFAVEAIKRAAKRPPISEVFAQVRADFVASGITEAELQQDIEQAQIEVRAEPPPPRNEKMLATIQRNHERLKDMPVRGSTAETLKQIRRARAGEMWGYEPTDCE